MITNESILHMEAWCALALAILSPVFLEPDAASVALHTGKPVRKSWDNVVPEMILLRKDGVSWSEVAEMFGYSVGTAQSMVTKWRSRKG